jgi:hypothetical protein
MSWIFRALGLSLNDRKISATVALCNSCGIHSSMIAGSKSLCASFINKE